MDRTQRNKSKLPLIVVLVFAALLAGLFVYHHYTAALFEMVDAKVDMTGYTDADRRVISLDGAWEYYPDQLIVSQGMEPGTKPELIRPGAILPRAVPQTGKASYRMVLTHTAHDLHLLLVIPNYWDDYGLYVNGTAEVNPTEPLAPTYFPLRNILGEEESEELEIVIELEQTPFVGLSKAPFLSSADETFYMIFRYRAVSLFTLGILFALFVIFPIVYRAYKNRLLRVLALTGCASFLVFLWETLWYYGMMGYIQQWISLHIFHDLQLLTRLALFYLVFQTQCILRRGERVRIQRPIQGVLAAGALACVILMCAGVADNDTRLVIAVCEAAALIPAAWLAVGNIRRGNTPASLVLVGHAVLAAGVILKGVVPWMESSFALQMAFVFALVFHLVCWILCVSDQRRHELAQAEKALDTEKALMKTQTAFLASQIQPHFLYNALTTIQELCYTDPMEAADTVVRFSNYLRHNIDFMDYEDKVPFALELAHIDNYIQIQRTRFGEDIQFRQEIGCEGFLLPPLTVQPLVENAVSHGIRKNSRRGTVTITARREGELVLITVQDDGQGFDPAAVHSRSMDNIRQRIERIMGGAMQVESVPGQGTRVTLTFPYEEVSGHEDRPD